MRESKRVVEYEDEEVEPMMMEGSANERYAVSGTFVQYVGLLSAVAMMVLALVKPSVLSGGYLVAGLTYLHLWVQWRGVVIFIAYTSVVLTAKITMLVLLLTDVFGDISQLTSDLLASLGFEFVTKQLGDSVMAFVPDVIALAVLILARVFYRNNREESGLFKSSTACSVFCWATLVLICVASLLVDSIGYCLIALVFVVLIMIWTMGLKMTSEVFTCGSLLLLTIVPVWICAIFFGQMPIAGVIGDTLLKLIGIAPLSGWKEYTALVTMALGYMCACFYREGLTPRRQPSASRSELAVGLLPSDSDQTHPQNEQPEEKVSEEKKSTHPQPEEKTGTQPPGQSKNLDEPHIQRERNLLESLWMYVTHIFYISIYTPEALLILLRLFLLLWTMKYATYFSIPVLIWVYYSIVYSERVFFFKWSHFLIMPIISAQYFCTKLINVPGAFNEHWAFFKYLENLGFFHLKSEDPLWEHLYMIIMFALTCATFVIRHQIPRYEAWSKLDQQRRTGEKPNNFELTVNWLLNQSDKAFMIILYIQCFKKINMINSLLMIFLVLNIFMQKTMRRLFSFAIIVVMVQSIVRYIVMMLMLTDVDVKPAGLVLTVLGLEINSLDRGKQFYKSGLFTNMIILYFALLVQYRLILYFRSVESENAPLTGWYAKVVNWVYNLLLKFLLWAIYIFLLLLLAYLDTNFLMILYIVLLLVIASTHMIWDLLDADYRGYEITRCIWVILSVYNGLVLCSTYVFCFIIYTVDFSIPVIESQESLIEAMKIVGLSFEKPDSYKMHIMFLPQFAVLYLSFIARSHIADRMRQPPAGPSEIVYRSVVVGACLRILDFLSTYSFHIFFLLVTVLAFMWNLSFGMLMYLAIFGIHYITLHLRYLRSRRVESAKFGYERKDAVAAEESAHQRRIALFQRRSTVMVIVVYTAILMFLAEISRFCTIIKHYIDRHVTGEVRLKSMSVIEAVQGTATYLGTINLVDYSAFNVLIATFGYLLIYLYCVLETKSIDWMNNRMGVTFTWQPPEPSPADDNKLKLLPPPTTKEGDARETALINEEEMGEAEPGVSIKKLKQKIVVMTILKVILEHVIIGAFLLAAVMKNNILELLMIPVAVIAIFLGVETRMSYFFSIYTWVLLFYQYFICAANMTNESTPQTIEDVIFIKMFQLPKWPVYKLILTGWNPKDMWATYFTLGNRVTTRLMFIFDIITLLIQSVYFQYFCHPAYSLSKENRERTQSLFSERSEGEELSGREYLLKALYTFLRKVMFVYSHIFTLFTLLLLNVLGRGFISLPYLIISVTFIQFNVFTFYRTKRWSLPFITRYILTPYVLLDITVHFVFQIPRIVPPNWKDCFRHIGIESIEENATNTFLKIFMFCVVIYQSTIYSSKLYCAFCQSEGLHIKKKQAQRQLCSAYMYNNRRIHEFVRQKYVLRENHSQLIYVKQSIKKWDQILHRTESDAANSGMSKQLSGLTLDIEEQRNKLDRMRRKLRGVEEYPQYATKSASFLAKLYLWLFDNVNHIAFMKGTELQEKERFIEQGAHSLPNYVIEYYKTKYIELKRKGIRVETDRLDELERKLQQQTEQVVQVVQPEPDRPLEEEEKKAPDVPGEVVGTQEPPAEPTREALEKLKASEIRQHEASIEELVESIKKEKKSTLPIKKLLWDILVLLAKMLYSSSSGLCYLFMVIAHVYYGNLLSLVYVLAIFGYALLVRGRPHSWYWRALRLYCGLVILLKFIVASLQEFMNAVVCKDQGGKCEVFDSLQANLGVRLGLFESTKHGVTIFVILDVMVIFALLFHTYVLTSLGLEEEHEENIETLSQAMERVNNMGEMRVSEQRSRLPLASRSSMIEVMEEDEQELLEERSEVEGKCRRCTKAVCFTHAIGRQLFPEIKNEKPGVNFHTLQITIHTILCIYTIFFFSNMSYENPTLTEINIKEFSSATVFALLFQVMFIIVDLYLYFMRPMPTAAHIRKSRAEGRIEAETLQKPNYALMGKFLFHSFQLIFINVLVFWILPNNGNMRLKNHQECTREDMESEKCAEANSNPFLLVYFLIYCVYFAFSGLQIQYGWPERDESTTMKPANAQNKLAEKIFYAVPFAWELKQFSSWLWTRTSLDLFQWLKFEEIYLNLYFAKCEAKSKKTQYIGKEVGSVMKLALGGCGLFLLLVLIIGPIFIFSTLNPMVMFNNPVKASMSIKLAYAGTQTFQLLENNAPIQAMSQNVHSDITKQFDEIRGIDIGQCAVANYTNSSDTYIFPTTEVREYLRQYFTSQTDVQIIFRFTFSRPNPPNNQEVFRESSVRLNTSQILELSHLFSYSKDSIVISMPMSFCTIIVLPIAEQPYKAARCESHGSYMANVRMNLTLRRFNISNNQQEVPLFHATLMERSNPIFLMSEKAKSSFMLNYSLITLYVSVVLVIGKLLRGFLSGSSYRIIYEELPKPVPLYNLSSGILIARYEGNLIKEGELYYELIEVMRSTEILKLITKTSKEVYRKKPT